MLLSFDSLGSDGWGGQAIGMSDGTGSVGALSLETRGCGFGLHLVFICA